MIEHILVGPCDISIRLQSEGILIDDSLQMELIVQVWSQWSIPSKYVVLGREGLPFRNEVIAPSVVTTDTTSSFCTPFVCFKLLVATT